MNSAVINRFFGGSPGSVLVRLVVMSFILGIVLSAFGVSPFDIVTGLQQLLSRIYHMGFESVEWIWRYFLLGAVIVFPVWLISRVLKFGGRRSDI
jgi:hypothetical protein